MPKVGDLIFIDTNVLLTATDESRQSHQIARRLITESGTRGFHLSVSGQILREYLVVATRPLNANGLGFTTKDAMSNVKTFLGHVECLEEVKSSALKLLEITEILQLRGKRIHDANILATMLVHGVQCLVTDNLADFAWITSFTNTNPVALADLEASVWWGPN